jgi:DUF438 domain-containing protein
MTEFPKEKEQRKAIVKDIILKLHKGLSVEEARDRFLKEVGSITSLEIAEIEQSLIQDGLSPDEIKKFCNVHALLFESELKKAVVKEESSAHPIHLFKMENREIEKITASLKELIKNKDKYKPEELKQEIKNLLEKLNGVDLHYVRKEQALFPYLERYGFFGPSKVMWGKDNEIRELLKAVILNLDKSISYEDYINNHLNPLITEIEGMIFKEENILFPASLEKLSINDWVEILKESDDIGYVFIERPKDTLLLIKELKEAVIEEPEIKEGNVLSLPTGFLNLKELMWMLNTLPVEITFVDKDGTVKYFSANKERIFVRTKSIIGRKVQNCHPPQSLEAVENIVNSFKSGKKDVADFWINLQGKLIYIRYFAVRDENRKYLGTVEVSQDITNIVKLAGEKRLLDEQ